MYVRMYVCKYVRTYVCRYVCMYVLCMYVRMYVLYTYVCMCVRTRMYVRSYVCMYVRMYVCMYVCMYVRMYVRTYICMFVCMCMYRPTVTTKIGKVFRNRTGCLALPVPRPVVSGYREFDPQIQILKVNSLASHNHPPVLGLKKTFHTVQCSSNKPPSKRSKSTARRQRSLQYKCRQTLFAKFLISFSNDVRAINLFLVVASLTSQRKSRFSITESLISN